MEHEVSVATAAHRGAATDAAVVAATAAVFAGWFLSDLLSVSLGSLEHGVRFFEMSALIADPTRVFFGFEAPWHRGLFGALCLLCLSAPVFAWRHPRRLAALGCFAPLLLMLACAALLYLRTAGDFLQVPADAPAIKGGVLRFANGLVNRGGALVSHHLSPGVGAYLALAGGLVLAQRGVQRLRGRRPEPAG